MLSEERRPRRLADVVGQEAMVAFAQAWVREHLHTGAADAWLLHGASGCGKSTIARAVAAELGCTQWDIELVPSRGCTLEVVEGIMDRFNHTSLIGGGTWKVAIVDEVDLQSKAAEDAWLSALEQIPPNRLIVFTTNNITAFDGDRGARWLSRVKCFELKAHSEHALYNIMLKAIPNVVDYPVNVSPDVLKDIACRVSGNGRFALQELEKHLLLTPPDAERTEVVNVPDTNGTGCEAAGRESSGRSAMCPEPGDQHLPAPAPERVPELGACPQSSGRTDPGPGVRVPASRRPREPVRPDTTGGADAMNFTVRPSSTGREAFCEVLFPEKPSEAILTELKAARFQWCRFRDGVEGTGGVWWGKKANLPDRYGTPPKATVAACSEVEPSTGTLTPPVPITPVVAPTVAPPSVKETKPEPTPEMIRSIAETMNPDTCALCGGPNPWHHTADAILCDACFAEVVAIRKSLEPKPKPEPKPVVAPAPEPAGLIIRETMGGTGWSVVHAASDAALGPAFSELTEDEALRLLNVVLPLADWTKPLEELVKLPGLAAKMKKATVKKDLIAPENKPVEGKVYALTGGKDEPCIANGNTWEQSVVKPVDPPVAKNATPEPEQWKPAPVDVALPKVDFAAKLRGLITRRK